jgi:tripartite motif-containing protein 71
MLSRRRDPRQPHSRRRWLGLTFLAVAAYLACAAAGALAEACPGAGASPCPYVAAQLIGRRAEGVLRFPEGVAVDPQGDVFVADQLSYVVQKFNAEGALQAEWGSYGGGHGQFGPIGGLAADAAGNVYVVDSSHNRVEKFDSSGNFIGTWGHRGSELGAFNFGSSQDYTHPPGGGIAVTGGYVYVADSGNDRVERFNLEGGEPLQWGTYGSGPGQFSYPRGVAANAGEVIVSDDNFRLQRFDPAGAYQGSVGSQGTGPGQFGFPYGVALDAAGNVYVADDLNHRVVKLDPQLSFLGAWGGFGSRPGQLAFPRALASDPAGDTYVADTANDRIEVFDTNGNYLRTIGVSARGPGQLTAPRGLGVDPSGRLLVSDTDGNRVELFAPGTEAYVGQWTATGGQHTGLSGPSGIGVDPRGSVYVADPGNARLVRFWGDDTFLAELAGPASLGGAQLNGAGSVAVAPGSGWVWVADSGHNRVLLYGPEGMLRARVGAGEGDGAAGRAPGEFNHPDAVAVNGAGEAYVADTANNRIVKLSPTGSPLAQWGSRGTGEGRFRSPTGVAVDGAGTVYVVDSENNRVQAFDANGVLLEKWGLRGAAVGEFSQPTAIATDCGGSVYVADTNNNRVERFAMAAPAGAGCLAAGAWPPPLDVPPVLYVSVPRAAGVLARGALALTVRCQRGCKILASATLSPFGRRGSVALVAAARAIPSSLTGHVRLRLGPRALRRLRRGLGRGKLMTARVTIVAAGPTGRRTTVTRRYVVGR